MPRREDERRLNLSAKHPAACTCKDCSEKFAQKLAAQNEKLAQKLLKKLSKKKKKSGLKTRVNEVVKAHPPDCDCASCAILGSIEF
ncbi:MAG: hypothetical protein BZY81_03450 [SAR202 cluster bacterium Io17-Chloro-G4]|nr:MAG: hypothetical protein BZY81_03450 [SAR202 cluster bacterium Io17-Chloro-G4]